MEDKQDYYVYVHKRKDNDVVFYVGSGRLDRCNTKDNSRSRDWLEIVESVGFYSEKIYYNLTKKEAMTLEESLISDPKSGWKLVNKAKSGRINELDYGVFSNLFYYDESSPSGLRYKKDVSTGYYITKLKGGVAGNKHTTSGEYVVGWRLKLNGKDYKVHRIIWLLLNGSIDSRLVVDHIDNNPLNNNIHNLRLVSYHLHGRNKKPSHLVNSRTGIVGVMERNGVFLAQMRDENAKRTTKSFSINKYGEKKALYLAVKVRYEYLINQEEHLKFTDSHSCLEELTKIITDFESQGEHLGASPTNV